MNALLADARDDCCWPACADGELDAPLCESCEWSRNPTTLHSRTVAARAMPRETPREAKRASWSETPIQQERANVAETPTWRERARLPETPDRSERAREVETPMPAERARKSETPTVEERAKVHESPDEQERAENGETPKTAERASMTETPKMRERTGAAECWRRCYYCGFDDAQVEAAGVWRCPNALCPGPGAAWWRSRLGSYREVDGGRHTVDEGEWIAAGLAYADTLEDAALAGEIRATAQRMREP